MKVFSISFFVFLFSFFLIASDAEKKPLVPKSPVKADSPSPEFSAFAEKLMKEILKAVREKHYNDKIVEWDKISAEFLPKVKKCKNQRELLRVLNKMVKSLGQSHIYVLPPNSSTARKALKMHVKNVKKAAAPSVARKPGFSGPGDPGLKFCMANGEICVLDVKKNSSSDKAGVKIGDILLAVNGLDLKPKRYSDLPWNVLAERILVGRSGSEVKLSLKGADGKTREVALQREPNGSDWVKVGIMSKLPGKFEYKTFPGNIAYVAFSPFFVKQIENIKKLAKGDLANAKALVIDLRNNPGGLIMMPTALGGWLSDKTINFGSMPTKGTTLHLKSFPQKKAFTGPIAILVNKGSASCSEIFAAGMQDSGRAVVIGETTSGMCLPSAFILLSGGYRLQTVFGDFIRTSGERVEKKGVKPDIEVEITREKLLKGKDPVLETALGYLSGEMKNAKSKSGKTL